MKKENLFLRHCKIININDIQAHEIESDALLPSWNNKRQVNAKQTK